MADTLDRISESLHGFYNLKFAYESVFGFVCLQYDSSLEDANQRFKESVIQAHGPKHLDAPYAVLHAIEGSNRAENSLLSKCRPRNGDHLDSFFNSCNCCEFYVMLLDGELWRNGVKHMGSPLTKTYRLKSKHPRMNDFNPNIINVQNQGDIAFLDTAILMEPMPCKDPEGLHVTLVAEFKNGCMFVFDPTNQQTACDFDSLKGLEIVDFQELHKPVCERIKNGRFDDKFFTCLRTYEASVIDDELRCYFAKDFTRSHRKFYQKDREALLMLYEAFGWSEMLVSFGYSYIGDAIHLQEHEDGLDDNVLKRAAKEKRVVLGM